MKTAKKNEDRAQSQFFFNECLELIKNEIQMRNARIIFMSSVEGLLFTSYGLCLNLIFKGDNNFSNVPLPIIAFMFFVPIMGIVVARATEISLDGGAATLDKIEAAWNNYVKLYKIDISLFPPLRPKKYKNHESMQNHADKRNTSWREYKVSYTGGRVSVKTAISLFILCWLVVLAITVYCSCISLIS